MLKEIRIEGSVPKITSMPEVMEKLSKKLEADVKEDQQKGGNPTWKPRIFPSGAAHLNYISKTLRRSSTKTSATVGWGEDLPYAVIHEEGGQIPKTDRMRRFFWAKWYETNEDFWKNMAISKKSVINIPSRPILPGIMDRANQYAEFIGQNVVITKEKPIT